MPLSITPAADSSLDALSEAAASFLLLFAIERVAVEVERAALLHRVWEDLLDGAEHTRGLVAGAMRTPEALAP
ncbi:MAG: hypothetical protein DUD39_13710 [Coriobacteriaceae bacterium]|nr:MAG: hypothetical protein DUD39_13710 [Coriobacteriaceae bacterium]